MRSAQAGTIHRDFYERGDALTSRSEFERP